METIQEEKPSQLTIQKDGSPEEEGYESDDAYVQEDLIPQEEVEKMRLHSLSEDNKFFLFYKEAPIVP